MNRQLHNTLSALAASSSLLVLGLMAAAPLTPQQASVGAADAPRGRFRRPGIRPPPSIHGVESAAEATAVGDGRQRDRAGRRGQNHR